MFGPVCICLWLILTTASLQNLMAHKLRIFAFWPFVGELAALL